ncbi:MAG TPA: ATP-binding protein, partial [Streptosporangiaceae bacterium]|nr:ATP-binding protein [Streptosporangiaceae bacterium]
SNATSRRIPGTGLGLAIVATIIANHHGAINLASTEGTGTTVTIHLPLSNSAPEVVPPTTTPRTRSGPGPDGRLRPTIPGGGPAERPGRTDAAMDRRGAAS